MPASEMWAEDFDEGELEAAAPAPDAEVGGSLMEMADEMERCKEWLERQEQRRKLVQTRYDHLRKHAIPEAMLAAGLVNAQGKGSFTTAMGSRISLREDLYASYSKDQEAALFQELADMGHGDLIRLTVNNQTLRAFVRELREEGRAVPDLIKVTEETAVTLTRARR